MFPFCLTTWGFFFVPSGSLANLTTPCQAPVKLTNAHTVGDWLTQSLHTPAWWASFQDASNGGLTPNPKYWIVLSSPFLYRCICSSCLPLPPHIILSLGTYIWGGGTNLLYRYVKVRPKEKTPNCNIRRNHCKKPASASQITSLHTDLSSAVHFSPSRPPQPNTPTAWRTFLCQTHTHCVWSEGETRKESSLYHRSWRNRETGWLILILGPHTNPIKSVIG